MLESETACEKINLRLIFDSSEKLAITSSSCCSETISTPSIIR